MNDIIEILRSYSRLGEKKLENGATLIGKAPHIAPMAWPHTIYKPLSLEEIDSLESKLKMPIPKWSLNVGMLKLFRTRYS